MATVYRAWDEQLQRAVALKVVENFATTGVAGTDDFLREARAAAGLQHPNVVTVFDVGQDDGRPFIAMELIEGGDLDQLLRARGPLSPGQVAQIAHGVALGLGELHTRGLVHCDVKPHNVLLTLDGQPRVADFGIARAVTATGLVRQEELVGTAAYLSPEQVNGERIDPRTDVYALGLLLYEMLSGQPPFAGGSFTEIAARRLVTAPTPIRKAAPGTPRRLAAIVDRALKLDPDRRFPDGAAIAAALAPMAKRAIPRIEASTARTAPIPRGAASDDATVHSRPTVVNVAAPASARRRLSLRLPLLIAGAVLLLLVGAVLAYGAVKDSGPRIAIPDVAGLRFEDASQHLVDAGLKPVKSDEPVTLTTPRGLVITQQPSAGQAAKSGGEVRLTVSAGMAVPGEVGKPLEEAKAQLQQYGWTVGQVRSVPASGAVPGVVLAQRPSPEAGPIADKAGTPVDLDVAGPISPPPPTPRTPAPQAAPTAPAPSQAEDRQPAKPEPPGRARGRGN